MSVAEHVHRLGGFADHRTLVRLTSRRRVAQALADGDIVQLARGRYALPTADVAVARAHGLGGVVSHLSAAAWWQWELKAQPALPQVTVPKHRRIRGTRHGVHFVDLHPDDVYDEVVTARERTIVDCLRTLPFDEGLTVVDSALRHLDVTKSGLAVIARDVRGPGSPAVRTAIRHASGEAANPFESVLRATAIQAGLSVKPQAVVRKEQSRCDQTSSTRAGASCWRPTRSPGTAPGPRSNATVVATTGSFVMVGASCGSPMRT